MDLMLSSIRLGAGEGVRGQDVWISLGTETRLKEIMDSEVEFNSGKAQWLIMDCLLSLSYLDVFYHLHHYVP